MEELRKIIQLDYNGPVDQNGLPHGSGTMTYRVEPQPDAAAEGLGNLRYTGQFVHGKRQGEGDFHALGLLYNPVSEYEWYAEGDYDSCGRFIQSAHAPGSWKRYIACWYPYFEGTWMDDMPLESRWKSKTTADELEHIRRTTMEALKDMTLTLVQ